MKEDVTEENLQARIRGNLLMALSNKFGWLVLTTGNKSEYSVGYTTLYGDMAGGFAVIKDVPKMLVYDVARHVNERSAPALPRLFQFLSRETQHRFKQTDLRIANRKLRRMHAHRQSSRPGREVIPAQRPLPPLIQLPLRIES